MRIPFIRFGSDDSPVAWWEWLFAPIVWMIFIPALLIAAVISVPVTRHQRVQQNRREDELKNDLTARGRYISWEEAEAELIAGRGTLIIEHQSPKGPIREWWTSDDVIATSPVALPTSFKSSEKNNLPILKEYVRSCVVRYVDLENGIAKLTEVLVPHTGRRDLAKRYGKAKMVTLVLGLGEPLLAIGDSEALFLATE